MSNVSNGSQRSAKNEIKTKLPTKCVAHFSMGIILPKMLHNHLILSRANGVLLAHCNGGNGTAINANRNHNKSIDYPFSLDRECVFFFWSVCNVMFRLFCLVLIFLCFIGKNQSQCRRWFIARIWKRRLSVMRLTLL